MRVEPKNFFIKFRSKRSLSLCALTFLICALGYYNFETPSFSNTSNSNNSELKVNHIEVLVANTSIAPGYFLDESNISFRSLPLEAIPNSAVSQWAEIKGKVALAPIAKNSVIAHEMLARPILILPAAIEPASIEPNLAVEALKSSKNTLTDSK